MRRFRGDFLGKCCRIYPVFFLLAAICPAQQAPETFLMRPDFLHESRQKVRQGDASLGRAVEALRKEADEAMANGPYSVTFKEKVPPGGTRHDYMSVGPYWWPDPSKPDGLPYIRKDGQVNPERFTIRDAEYHGALCRDVHLLGLAWYYTGDERYARHAVDLLKVWFLDPETRMNPHLNYGQAIPGITNGRGIGLIDTKSLVNLIDGVQLLKGSAALTDLTYSGVREWYGKFLHWMLHSPIGMDEARQHNNHGTYYDVQVIAIALFTGQPELAKEIIEKKTKPRIDSQLAEDGSQPHELARTLSWGYSQMNLQGFFKLATLAENVKIDLWNYTATGGKGLKKAFLWMLPYAEGSKPWTHQQIKPIDKTAYLKTAFVAAQKYPDIHPESLQKLQDGPPDMMLLLTNTLP